MAPDGNRKQVRLGDVSMKSAESIKRFIERIIEAQGLGVPLDAEVVAWMQGISDKLAARLAAKGLMAPRVKADAERPVGTTIAEFVDKYIAMRSDVKPNTLRVWRQTRDLLVEHFGQGREIAAVTAFEGRGFHSWLSTVTRKPKRKKAASQEGLAGAQ